MSWRGIPGHFTFPDLYDHVARHYGGALMVEVGVEHGRSAAYLANGVGAWCAHSGWTPGALHLVDTFSHGEGYEREVRGRVLDAGRGHGVGLGVAAHRGLSWEKAGMFREGEVSFVFLDADHAYESVEKDIAAWWPKVRVGGMLAGHDYSAAFPGVLQAVTEAFPKVEVWRGEPYRGLLGDGPEEGYFPCWAVVKV